MNRFESVNTRVLVEFTREQGGTVPGKFHQDPGFDSFTFVRFSSLTSHKPLIIICYCIHWFSTRELVWPSSKALGW